MGKDGGVKEAEPRFGFHDLSLLEGLEAEKNVSQRDLARRLGISSSQVNRRLRKLQEAGHVRIVDAGVRPYAYRLTPRGEVHRRRLVHRHFESVVGNFEEMREHVRWRLRQIAGDGLRRLVLYGAGAVMETALPLATDAGIEIVGLVDDDPEKQDGWSDGQRVLSPDAIPALQPDAVLVTTFRHSARIRDRLDAGLDLGVPVLEL